MQIDHNDLYPYLLVNIGSGVSMIKVILNIILSSVTDWFSSIYTLPFFKNFNSFPSCRLMEMESLTESAEQVLVEALFGVWESF